MHNAVQPGSVWILSCQRNILINSASVYNKIQYNTIRSNSINFHTTERSVNKNNWRLPNTQHKQLPHHDTGTANLSSHSTWKHQIAEPSDRKHTQKKNIKNEHVKSGFRRDAAENCVLLGCYAASNGNFLPTFRDNLSVPSSRVKILTLENGIDRVSGKAGKTRTLHSA